VIGFGYYGYGAPAGEVAGAAVLGFSLGCIVFAKT
jgi:hypothetical protein